MIPLPIEVDDAVEALRNAREACGRAVDSLNELQQRAGLIAPFAAAQEAAGWGYEQTAAVLAANRQGRRDDELEERRIDTLWDEDRDDAR